MPSQNRELIEGNNPVFFPMQSITKKLLSSNLTIASTHDVPETELVTSAHAIIDSKNSQLQPTKKILSKPLPTRKNAMALGKLKATKCDDAPFGKSHPKKCRASATKNAVPPKKSKYNSIDEVLDESDAFLQCAYEAQSLGRLNEAHNYLILAHGRLVGLGRFVEHGDTASCHRVHRNTLDKIQGTLSPQGVPSSLNSIITPSPANHTPNDYEGKCLADKLAQRSQELLYTQKGLGYKYASYTERKAYSNQQRKARAASYDSKEVTDSSSKLEKENRNNSLKSRRQESRECCEKCYTSFVCNASNVTADFACLNAKSLLKNKELLP